jgi:23S rRNA maturation mini-RNase III
MTELSIQEIKDKIFQAKQDMARMQSDGITKQAEILESYLEYLQDQLKEAEQRGNN